MTITIRIQYKGDAARKLALEEGNTAPSDPPKYVEELDRALSHFSIPPPHSSRAIWKSGFVLCNWEITRDSVGTKSPYTQCMRQARNMITPLK
jgi:hypothetical protein